MIRKAIITIPQPCHEDWNKMSVVERGHFCDSCKKNVYDFTKATDREILERINSANICGRFRPSQLNRDITVPKEKSSLWIAATAGILALLNPEVEAGAQNPQVTVQTDNYANEVVEKVMPQTSQEKTVTGVISDATDVLPGAIVIVQRTNRSTQTDIDGKYSIEASVGEILVVSFIGFADKTVTVGSSSTYDVILESSGATIGEVVSGRKRTLFGRTFTWLRNLFRTENNKKNCLWRY